MGFGGRVIVGFMSQLAASLLSHLSNNTSSQFELRRSVLSFDAYLREVESAPHLHLRSAAHYMADAIDYYSSYEVSRPQGSLTRFRVFDAPFDQGETQVLGHERVQEAMLRQLRNFVRNGRCDKLILLHGPNGSAKSSLVNILIRTAESYSQSEEGMLYRINWVFPAKKSHGLGFSEAQETAPSSYALLEHDKIAAKIACELKDHPLLLLDQEQRGVWFKQLKESGRLEADFPVAEVLRTGDMSYKNKKIFDALLMAYKGDFASVFRHIQVERFYLSKRYRSGVSIVEPQMSVDASARQVTLDQSLADLPAQLQHIALFETQGPLSEANRGMIEFNDLLKKPLETWKYLLVATEQGGVSVNNLPLFFDLLMVGSSNEIHLTGFREYPDWQSFKGRFELIRVPYLLRVTDELGIYQTQIPRALSGTYIDPHALKMAARWAVLTRLEAPVAEHYDESDRELVMSLTPAEKMALYDSGTLPERLTQKEARDLKRLMPKLCAEWDQSQDYEGRYGASPREIRTLLLNASQHAAYDYLSPLAVLSELEKLTQEKSSYEFLRRSPLRNFRDAQGFVGLVKELYLAELTDEIRCAAGLVAAGSHEQLFERYIRHVSAWTKREKLMHPTTQKLVDPDSAVMGEVERVLVAKGEQKEDFRRALISQIGAFRLETPEGDVDYKTLFQHHLKKLKSSYFEEQTKAVQHVAACFLKRSNNVTERLEDHDLQLAESFGARLAEAGYTPKAARDAVAFFMAAQR